MSSSELLQLNSTENPAAQCHSTKSTCRSVGLMSAGGALGIPHEVRVKLGKRLRAEQVRRYNDRELELLKAFNDKSPNQVPKKKISAFSSSIKKVVAFEAKDKLLDAARNGNTDEGEFCLI